MHTVCYSLLILQAASILSDVLVYVTVNLPARFHSLNNLINENFEPTTDVYVFYLQENVQFVTWVTSAKFSNPIPSCLRVEIPWKTD